MCPGDRRVHPGRAPVAGHEALFGPGAGIRYQWWIPENPQGDFLTIGIHDQFIYVSPRNHVVIAKTSTYADYDRDGEEKELESIAFFRVTAESMK
jgi:CubicO group peptidase (beta-lactamase class C family)